MSLWNQRGSSANLRPSLSVRSEGQTEAKLKLPHGLRARNLSKRRRGQSGIWTIQAHRIEYVAGLHARLEIESLLDLEVPKDSQIYVPKAGAIQQIARRVSVRRQARWGARVPDAVLSKRSRVKQIGRASCRERV